MSYGKDLSDLQHIIDNDALTPFDQDPEALRRAFSMLTGVHPRPDAAGVDSEVRSSYLTQSEAEQVFHVVNGVVKYARDIAEGNSSVGSEGFFKQTELAGVSANNPTIAKAAAALAEVISSVAPAAGAMGMSLPSPPSHLSHDMGALVGVVGSEGIMMQHSHSHSHHYQSDGHGHGGSSSVVSNSNVCGSDCIHNAQRRIIKSRPVKAKPIIDANPLPYESVNVIAGDLFSSVGEIAAGAGRGVPKIGGSKTTGGCSNVKHHHAYRGLHPVQGHGHHHGQHHQLQQSAQLVSSGPSVQVPSGPGPLTDFVTSDPAGSANANGHVAGSGPGAGVGGSGQTAMSPNGGGAPSNQQQQHQQQPQQQQQQQQQQQHQQPLPPPHGTPARFRVVFDQYGTLMVADALLNLPLASDDARYGLAAAVRDAVAREWKINVDGAEVRILPTVSDPSGTFSVPSPETSVKEALIDKNSALLARLTDSKGKDFWVRQAQREAVAAASIKSLQAEKAKLSGDLKMKVIEADKFHEELQLTQAALRADLQRAREDLATLTESRDVLEDRVFDLEERAEKVPALEQDLTEARRISLEHQRRAEESLRRIEGLKKTTDEMQRGAEKSKKERERLAKEAEQAKKELKDTSEQLSKRLEEAEKRARTEQSRADDATKKLTVYTKERDEARSKFEEAKRRIEKLDKKEADVRAELETLRRRLTESEKRVESIRAETSGEVAAIKAREAQSAELLADSRAKEQELLKAVDMLTEQVQQSVLAKETAETELNQWKDWARAAIPEANRIKDENTALQQELRNVYAQLESSRAANEQYKMQISIALKTNEALIARAGLSNTDLLGRITQS